MAVGTEMLVDFYCIVPFHVVAVLVYAPVALLGFQLAHILPTVSAPVAPGEIKSVLRTTVRFLANLELFPASSVREDIGVDNV